VRIYYNFNIPLTLSTLPFLPWIPFGGLSTDPNGVRKGMKMAKKVNTAPKLTIAAGTQTVFFSQGMHYNKR
jgi:hypothetical protein